MNDTLTSAKFRLVGRDGSGNGGGLSTGTIIVIAVVCGCVAILALTLFLWRLLVRCCRTEKSAPLPPVQELAHHRREQQRAAFPQDSVSRPTTWVVPPSGTPYTGSSVSLLTSKERNGSAIMDDVATAESSTPSPIDDGKLYPPHPSFYRTSEAASSRNTLDDNASSRSSLPSAVSPSPTLPISESSSNASPFNTMSRSSSRQSSVPPAQSSYPRARAPSASRGRPLSQISDSPTTRSGFTVRSSSTVRGAPHLPGNSIQIVLPAPLASQVPVGADGSGMYTHHQHSRSSVFADQWLAPKMGEQITERESLDAPRT